ncbi:hypothetical protein K2Q16_03110 [Patescibacteria group bacterium]|nr:hypothetical protein [Patescibacteria group bacterium]
MERPTQRTNPLTGPAHEFGTNNPSFRLNKVAAAILGDGDRIKLKPDDTTWVGKYSRTPTTQHERTITYGTGGVPETVAQRWGIAEASPKEQLVFKFAHELAHAFLEQSGYERTLLQWLDGHLVPQNQIPIIHLYLALEKVGRVSGLSTMDVYRRQSEQVESGRLNVAILEDITELVAAYFLGDEYYMQKIDQSVTNLTQVAKDVITANIILLCKDFS